MYMNKCVYIYRERETYVYVYVYVYIYIYIFGKIKLSCDVIVVNNFPHQVIVFE